MARITPLRGETAGREGAFPARPMPEDTLMELAPSGTVIFLVEIAWRPMS